MGGRYKCGGCGCKAELMDDQAHALRCKWRSTADVCLSKEKISVADLRTTLIDVFMLLVQSNGSNDIQYLLQIIIRVSEVLYSSDEERTPRRVLQLYNNTWLHHELCRDLLTNVTSSRTSAQDVCSDTFVKLEASKPRKATLSNFHQITKRLGQPITNCTKRLGQPITNCPKRLGQPITNCPQRRVGKSG